MPIKVQCPSCSKSFKAKDELAGRRVKCPGCKQPINIPAKAPAPAPAGAAYDPLLDLLDEEDVRSVARGPVCGNCGVEAIPGSMICIECGFNHETGIKLETEVGEEGARSESSMTDAERIMAKAEQDIDDMPINADDQDFGDGSESYLIAAIAGIMGLVLIAIGLIVILSMEQLATQINSAGISFIASIILYIGMGVWITIVAFQAKQIQGIASICSGFLWCMVFGFMQGKTLLLPSIIMVITLVMGLATGIYISYNGMDPVVDG